MEITYFGYSCVELKQKGTVFLMDPYEPTGKMAHPRAKAHVVTVSRPATADENRVDVPGVDEEPLVLVGPGGYEAKGVLIDGIASFADNQEGHEYGPNTIFSLQWGGMNIAHLGRIGHELSADDLEELGTVDILCIMCGDRTSAQVGAKLIDQIEPRVIVLLVHDDAATDQCIKEVGVDAEVVDTLKIEVRDLPSDGQKLYRMRAQ